MTEKLISDIGGEPAGPIPREDHNMLFWEKQMIATFNVLQGKKLIVTDELRRIVEEMSPEHYGNTSYYNRRLESIASVLIEKGIIDRDALEKRTQEILAAGTRDHV